MVLTMFKILLIFIFLLISPLQAVEVGKCYYNIADYNSLLIVHQNHDFVVSTYYTQSGMIYGLFTVDNNKISKDRTYRLYGYECPRFTMIHSVTIERIKNTGLEKSFILAICKSRTINRARNRELCRRIENDK